MERITAAATTTTPAAIAIINHVFEDPGNASIAMVTGSEYTVYELFSSIS